MDAVRRQGVTRRRRQRTTLFGWAGLAVHAQQISARTQRQVQGASGAVVRPCSAVRGVLRTEKRVSEEPILSTAIPPIAGMQQCPSVYSVYVGHANWGLARPAAPAAQPTPKPADEESSASESQRRHFRQQLDPSTGSCGSALPVRLIELRTYDPHPASTSAAAP